MPESNCRTCSYYMSGNPPSCNALHVPSIDKIDCSDWQLREDVGELVASAIEGLSAALQTRDAERSQAAAERFRATTRPTHQPSIALSEFRRLTAGIHAPRDLNDRWTIPLVPQSEWNRPTTPWERYTQHDYPIEVVTLTPIETPDGLKWQFQGTVILD